jgi:hypothetical protein
MTSAFFDVIIGLVIMWLLGYVLGWWEKYDKDDKIAALEKRVEEKRGKK